MMGLGGQAPGPSPTMPPSSCRPHIGCVGENLGRGVRQIFALNQGSFTDEFLP
jgi:hypothetical protein